jgi:hypothetical protein
VAKVLKDHPTARARICRDQDVARALPLSLRPRPGRIAGAHRRDRDGQCRFHPR